MRTQATTEMVTINKAAFGQGSRLESSVRFIGVTAVNRAIIPISLPDYRNQNLTQRILGETSCHYQLRASDRRRSSRPRYSPRYTVSLFIIRLNYVNLIGRYLGVPCAV